MHSRKLGVYIYVCLVINRTTVFPDLMDGKKCDIMKWTQTNPKSQEEFLCQSKKEQCRLVMTRHSRVAQSRWLPNRGDLQRKLPPNSVYVLKLSNHGSSVPAFSPVQPIVKTVLISVSVSLKRKYARFASSLPRKMRSLMY